mmetsp:Transcript_6754/g.23877  ORF Transcript_6754/g.23877 Transcript_6754/m.23877 type:complete len:187 (-) Transcript_6754:425-985(-)
MAAMASARGRCGSSLRRAAARRSTAAKPLTVRHCAPVDTDEGPPVGFEIEPPPEKVKPSELPPPTAEELVAYLPAEQLSGRLAMLGFVAAAAAEKATGLTALEQFSQAPLLVLLGSAVFGAAGLIPCYNGDRAPARPWTDLDIANFQNEQGEDWERLCEKHNGQAAMLGFATLVLQELLFGAPVFS